jgi:hypothetical protein
LPETKIPSGKCLGQFVEITGSQRLQKHKVSPAAACNCYWVAVFRLDRTRAGDRLELFYENFVRLGAPPPDNFPEASAGRLPTPMTSPKSKDQHSSPETERISRTNRVKEVLGDLCH